MYVAEEGQVVYLRLLIGGFLGAPQQGGGIFGLLLRHHPSRLALVEEAGGKAEGTRTALLDVYPHAGCRAGYGQMVAGVRNADYVGSAIYVWGAVGPVRQFGVWSVPKGKEHALGPFFNATSGAPYVFSVCRFCCGTADKLLQFCLSFLNVPKQDVYAVGRSLLFYCGIGYAGHRLAYYFFSSCCAPSLRGVSISMFSAHTSVR